MAFHLLGTLTSEGRPQCRPSPGRVRAPQSGLVYHYPSPRCAVGTWLPEPLVHFSLGEGIWPGASWASAQISRLSVARRGSVTPVSLPSLPPVNSCPCHAVVALRPMVVSPGSACIPASLVHAFAASPLLGPVILVIFYCLYNTQVFLLL